MVSVPLLCTCLADPEAETYTEGRRAKCSRSGCDHEIWISASSSAYGRLGVGVAAECEHHVLEELVG